MYKNLYHCKCGAVLYSLFSKNEGVCVYCKKSIIKRSVNQEYVKEILKIKTNRNFIDRTYENIEMTKNDPESLWR